MHVSAILSLPVGAIFQLQPFSRFASITKSFFGLSVVPYPPRRVLIVRETKLLFPWPRFRISSCSLHIRSSHVREIRVTGINDILVFIVSFVSSAFCTTCSRLSYSLTLQRCSSSGPCRRRMHVTDPRRVVEWIRLH